MCRALRSNYSIQFMLIYQRLYGLIIFMRGMQRGINLSGNKKGLGKIS
jgi:hypothetical protein